MRALTQQEIAVAEAVKLHEATHEFAHVGVEHISLRTPLRSRLVVVDHDSVGVAIDVNVVAFGSVLRIDDERV